MCFFSITKSTCRLLLITLSLLIVFAVSQNVLANDDVNVVVYGASGRIGGFIVNEALNRGHRVIGVSRNPDKFEVDHANFSKVKGDVTSAESMKTIIQNANADVVVISVLGRGEGNLPENTTQARAAQTAINVLYELGETGPRVIQIGGGITMLPDREAMMTTITEMLGKAPKPGTPTHAMFFGHMDALDTYSASNVKWTVLTPPFNIRGLNNSSFKRVGKYRTSTTELVKMKNGVSAISVADIGVALVDEIETSHFIGQRFTIGY